MTKLVLIWLLVFGNIYPGLVTLTPEEVQMIDRLKIGDTFTLRRPKGDDCNSCVWYYEKVSETEMRATGIGQCTLIACRAPWPMEKFK